VSDGEAVLLVVDAKFHALRHTTGMPTLRKIGNLRVVQKILGHTDIAITAKFYTDATLEDMRAAMEATAPRAVEATELKAIEKKGDK
jgi:site-specific recombinase XerD